MLFCAMLTCLRDTEEERYCAAALSREGGRICIDKRSRSIWAVETFLFVHQDSPVLSTARVLSSIFDMWPSKHFSRDVLLISSNTSRTKEPEHRFKDCMKKPVDAKQEFFFSLISVLPRRKMVLSARVIALYRLTCFFHCVSLDMVHVINLSLNCINNRITDGQHHWRLKWWMERC